jgi:hypothetical protein
MKELKEIDRQADYEPWQRAVWTQMWPELPFPEEESCEKVPALVPANRKSA